MRSLVLSSPIGALEFILTETFVCQVQLYSKKPANLPSTDLEQAVAVQVAEYFTGKRQRFALPVQWQTTQYRKQVCQSLADIPYGETITYGELAKNMGSGARAVGGACRHNPLPLLYPCHRVVAADSLGGFSGATQGEQLTVKQYLLELEKSHVEQFDSGAS